MRHQFPAVVPDSAAWLAYWRDQGVMEWSEHDRDRYEWGMAMLAAISEMPIDWTGHVRVDARLVVLGAIARCILSADNDEVEAGEWGGEDLHHLRAELANGGNLRRGFEQRLAAIAPRLTPDAPVLRAWQSLRDDADLWPVFTCS